MKKYLLVFLLHETRYSARNKVFYDIELDMMLENKNNNKMPSKA
jgi:hypothetical protein